MTASIWSSYPLTYRHHEVQALLSAILHGECASVLGLSGAGKSNLLGFFAHRVEPALPKVWVDCNRMGEPTAAAFWRMLQRALRPGVEPHPQDELTAVESSLAARLEAPEGKLCLLFDRFDAIPASIQPAVYGGLRSLRDDHKYTLTYVVASRRPIDPSSELAELFFAHTFWLGALSPADARWSAAGYAARAGLEWDEAALVRLIELSGGYPALLRAACEAFAAGCPLEMEALRIHPAVSRRLSEFWASGPTREEIQLSRLEGIPLLKRETTPSETDATFDTSCLTAKELRLWQYLVAHAGEVCEKDDLILAVWPEDKVFIEGIRDDSLAQLVRRLRRKAFAAAIVTIPGRGYKYVKRETSHPRGDNELIRKT